MKKIEIVYKKYNYFDWKKIIFSDESELNMHGSDSISQKKILMNKKN